MNPTNNTTPQSLPRRRQPLKHSVRCSVCRHPERKEIERRYRLFESLRKIAADFPEFSHSALARHTQYLGLHQQRVTRIQQVATRLLIESIPVAKALVTSDPQHGVLGFPGSNPSIRRILKHRGSLFGEERIGEGEVVNYTVLIG